MNELDDRLRSTFDAYRSQVRAPAELRESVAVRRRRVPVLAAAAVVAVCVLLAAVVMLDRGAETPVDVAAEGTLTPSAFDAAVGEACRRLDEGRNGLEPRFDTVEAYVGVAMRRRLVVERMAAELVALPHVDAEDRRAAWGSAIGRLRSAAAGLANAEAVAGSGDRAGAAAALDRADVLVQEAAASLAALGIGPCDFARGAWGET